MNKIKVKVINYYSEDGITIIDLMYCCDLFSVVVINEKDSNFVSIKEEVNILFKETEVYLSRVKISQSIKNILSTYVLDIEKGSILSRVYLDYRGHLIKSLITTRALEEMDIKEGEHIFALIEANDISIIKS